MEEIYRFKTPSENKTPPKPKVTYKFDYLKEWVLQFRPECIKNLTVNDVLMLPWDIALPWITLEEYIPARDHYGKYIESIEEWSKQRKEYAKKLVQEIKFKMKHGVFDQEKELKMLKDVSDGCDREENKERVKTISLEEYEKNKSKYADLDYDPGFTWFCWGAIGFIVVLGIIMFLI